MNHIRLRPLLTTLLTTLLATVAFAALAGSETRFAVYADDVRLVGTGKIEIESDASKAEVDLLRGYEGFVRVVADGAGGFVTFDGQIGPHGELSVIIGGDLFDLAAFIATFGDGVRLDLEFEDGFDRDDDPFSDDDAWGRDDDDDDGDDRDDDAWGRDDDDDDDDDRDDED